MAVHVITEDLARNLCNCGPDRSRCSIRSALRPQDDSMSGNWTGAGRNANNWSKRMAGLN